MNIERVCVSQKFDEIAELHNLCFGDNDFGRLVSRPNDFGDIYAFRDADTLIGYAVYGQVWLPGFSAAYISSIGVHPDCRQLGWGLRILNTIVAELITRPQDCAAVHADIRQSNLASQRLFKKARFYNYCELDGAYYDEIGLRVVKSLPK